MRLDDVKKRYISTTLDSAERRRIVVCDDEWRPVNESSQQLRRIFLELLADWGAFLQTSLYREAIIHFFGGSSVVLRRVTIYDSNTALGTHEMCLIAEDTALALTAIKDGRAQMKDHLQRCLAPTKLTCIQWINMDNHNIEFQTLERNDRMMEGRIIRANRLQELSHFPGFECGVAKFEQEKTEITENQFSVTSVFSLHSLQGGSKEVHLR
jgi:hypothetical protein